MRFQSLHGTEFLVALRGALFLSLWDGFFVHPNFFALFIYHCYELCRSREELWAGFAMLCDFGINPVIDKTGFVCYWVHTIHIREYMPYICVVGAISLVLGSGQRDKRCILVVFSCRYCCMLLFQYPRFIRLNTKRLF